MGNKVTVVYLVRKTETEREREKEREREREEREEERRQRKNEINKKKNSYRFYIKKSTIETDFPARLHLSIVFFVPGLLPSQNAIQTSHSATICAFLLIPALLPYNNQSGTISVRGMFFSFAYLRASASAPFAPPEIML